MVFDIPASIFSNLDAFKPYQLPLLTKFVIDCFSIDRWLVPPKPKPPPASIFGKLSALKPYQLSLPYLKNNYVYLSFLTFFLLVNVSLFVTRSFQYRKSSIFVIIARACGMLSSCFCNLIILPNYPTLK